MAANMDPPMEEVEMRIVLNAMKIVNKKVEVFVPNLCPTRDT